MDSFVTDTAQHEMNDIQVYIMIKILIRLSYNILGTHIGSLQATYIYIIQMHAFLV